MRQIPTFLFFFIAALLHADTFTVISSKKKIGPADAIEFVVSLESPADRVTVTARHDKPVLINGKRSIALEKKDQDGLVWGKDIQINTLLSPCLESGRAVKSGFLEFVPKIIRKGELFCLESAHNSWFWMPNSIFMHKGNPLPVEGKFHDGVSFDGRNDAILVKGIEFTPYKGTIEGWVFLPLLTSEKAGIIMFIEGRHPWSYHCLAVPEDSRKIVYSTYCHGKPNPSRSILSGTILKQDWVYFSATYDLARNEMELNVDGQHCGRTDYPFPCGGEKSDISMGGRIHNFKDGYTFVQHCGILLDEVRISNIVRDSVERQTQPFIQDKDTLLLFHFDDLN